MVASVGVQPPAQRWHDLDAVRAFALLLGVALHGAMSFMTPRIWIIDDSQHSTALNVAFYVIHMFRMTIFFVLAGFFARMMLQKKGPLAFIGNRLKRIALPLAVFWPLIMAAIIAALIIANPPVPGAPPVPPPPLTVGTFPLTHLWFLYALLILYAGAVVLKLVTDVLHVGGFLGRGLDAVVRLLVRSDLMILVLALPLAAMFYVSHGWTIWFGIPTPDTGLIPNVMATTAFVTAFTFGWWLNRSTDLVEHMAHRVWLYAPLAIAGTCACLYLAGTTPVLTPVAGHDQPLYAMLYPLTGWAWVFALIGAAHRFIRGENPVIRYLADASYWVYIVHLPILLGLQLAVRSLEMPAEAKYLVVVAGTIGIALLSYSLFVRYTFIGTILNGRRRKAKRTAATADEVTA